jgi:hypothetical protein
VTVVEIVQDINDDNEDRVLRQQVDLKTILLKKIKISA